MKTILVTLPTSHYCEKARWALERAGIPFEERGHLAFFSRLAAWRWGRWSSVPILNLDGKVLGDSTDILRWADEQTAPERRLFPDEAATRRTVEELEERFDTGIGPASRLLLLAHILPHRRLVLKITRPNVPTIEWLGLGASLPLARAAMRRMYGINAASVPASRDKLDEELAAVSAMLADGRRYLTGDRFTAADLTFAALAGPLVMPPRAPGLPTAEELPPEARADIERFRATPAGAFVLRLYETER